MLRERGWFDYDLVAHDDPPEHARADSGRWATWLVVALLLVKLLVTGWDCAAFDGSTYDENGLHAPRSRTGGLGLDGRVYNPPLYYLPVYPLAARQAEALGGWPEAEVSEEAAKVSRTDDARKALDDALLQRLRWTNLGHLALFYLAWIGLIIPRSIADRWSRLLAALGLLALPGYQKLAAMVHPDVAMTSLTALTIAAFVVLRVRDHERPPTTWALLGLALLGGLTALARPFGALTAAAALGGAGWLAWRRRAHEPARSASAKNLAWLGRSLAAALVVGACVLAWPAYQLAKLGHLAPVYSQRYTERYEPARDDFDRFGYFTRFYIVDLLRRPNRTIRALDTDNDEFHNRYGNSFWTLLYSDTWADHWLHFSGPVGVETRALAKRVALVAALPTIPWLGWRFFAGLRGVVMRLRERDPSRDLWALLTSFLLVGVGLYLYWQLGSGLSPGKNSSVKFIYVAYLVPVALLVCFSTPVDVRARKLALGFVLLLFAATLPFSVFIPS